MVEARTFAGKHVAVFGMGVSGLAAARSLLAGGASIVAWDDGERGREAARSEGFPVSDLRDADWQVIDALVLAPGVPLTHPEPHWAVELAAKNGVEIIGDTEIFIRERRRSGAATKLIAITGTNGKSTTTALTHHLLCSSGIDAVLGGNIGTAVLDLPSFEDGRHYVLELSSFQLDLTPSLVPDTAILLNITPDHLDRHGCMKHYAAVKEKIFGRLGPKGVAIIGAGDVFCDAIADRVQGRGIRVLRISGQKSLSSGLFSEGGAIFEAFAGRVEKRAELRGIGSLRGDHNAENAAAALAAARAMGVPWQQLAAGLRTFPGLAHRMEEIRRIGSVIFINDSKATNADAAERALLSFSNIYWIAGGKQKEGGIASLAPHFSRIKKAYLIGQASQSFAQTLNGRLPFSMSGTLDVALAEAAQDARAEEPANAVVLLSPACASYDQFPNFEVRGNAFRSLVEALPDDLAKGSAQ